MYDLMTHGCSVNCSFGVRYSQSDTRLAGEEVNQVLRQAREGGAKGDTPGAGNGLGGFLKGHIVYQDVAIAVS